MLNSTLVLAWEVLVPQDVPAATVERAAARAQWLVDSHASADSEVRRDIARRTLALARLRQGRYDEVEPLCAAALANPKLARRPRATVLATVALARQRLGQPYQAMLGEAQSLAPDAELVAETAASRDSSAHPLCRVRFSCPR